MRKPAYIISLFLLLFNGAGALYGGWSLMTDPSGTKIRLFHATLDKTPFPDFLIPGIVLFVCLGLFSLLAFFAVVLLQPRFSWLVLAEGSLLTGWIAVQYVLTQVYHPLQVIMGLTGMLLIACGYILYRSEDEIFLCNQK